MWWHSCRCNADVVENNIKIRIELPNNQIDASDPGKRLRDHEGGAELVETIRIPHTTFIRVDPSTLHRT